MPTQIDCFECGGDGFQATGGCDDCKGKGKITVYTADDMQVLRDEMEGHNMAAANALDKLWEDIILSKNANYGDWEYPGMAYRHIKAQIETDMQKAVEDEREACALLSLDVLNSISGNDSYSVLARQAYYDSARAIRARGE